MLIWTYIRPLKEYGLQAWNPRLVGDRIARETSYLVDETSRETRSATLWAALRCLNLLSKSTLQHDTVSSDHNIEESLLTKFNYSQIAIHNLLVTVRSWSTTSVDWLQHVHFLTQNFFTMKRSARDGSRCTCSFCIQKSIRQAFCTISTEFHSINVIYLVEAGTTHWKIYSTNHFSTWIYKFHGKIYRGIVKHCCYSRDTLLNTIKSSVRSNSNKHFLYDYAFLNTSWIVNFRCTHQEGITSPEHWWYPMIQVAIHIVKWDPLAMFL